MFRIIALPLLLVPIGGAVAQLFAIGSTTITFVDPSRNNRNIACEVYYPANGPGNNQPVAPGRHPVLSFGHGFVMGVNSYYNLRDAFVPQGYILVLPTTEGGFSPSHGNFGLDLAFVIAGMQARGADPASPFFERVASTAAIMGHSMGGGAAFLGASAPQVTTVVTYAAAETNPSAIAAAGGLQKPVLVLAGSQDCVTPPASNQLPMYNAVPSGCKAYVNLTGGGHCNFANSNFNCGFGEITCGGGGSLGRPAQQALTHQYTLLWLARYLKDDPAAGAQFEALLAAGQGIASQAVFANCPPPRVRADVRALLSGAYVPASGLMRDDLRLAALLPSVEPYTGLGYVHVGPGEAQALDPAVLQVNGAQAVVDWVFVELRDVSTASLVLATANGLVRRDGSITAPNGGALFFEAPPGAYRLAVRHRNHLGVVSAQAFALTREPAPVIDLAAPATPVFGIDARVVEGQVALLWAGDVNGDGRVRYTGADNDRDDILQAIGGTVPTATATGYLGSDVDLDGVVRYTGQNNDRDLVLLTIGGVVPTAERIGQLP
jgi:pimeloyl-ACP methyl ester carboxylesterase